jgi:competence protein ComGC
MRTARNNQAFTLVEMTLIVVMIGITLLFAIPRVEAQNEIPVTSKGFTFLYELKGAQDHYHRIHGTFARHVEALGVEEGIPNDFSLLELNSENWSEGWTAILQRHSRWSSFGPYQIVFSESGFREKQSSVCKALIPRMGR